MKNAHSSAGDAWSPSSWRQRVDTGRAAVPYEDLAAVTAAVKRLGVLPPLVTSWEIERLREQIAEAQQGRRFLLQGGDCAETLADCRPDVITGKIKILLQMSVVLSYAGKRPVTMVGRLAGQYAKPRSSETETRQGADGSSATLPNYYGDLVNRAGFTPAARRPDPALLVEAYQHAALTLNFIRSLLAGGFADAHHPEYWDLGFLKHAGLRPEVREEYHRLIRTLGDGLDFMEALGERRVNELTRAELFTSHEGLNLWYESAQTREVPRREGHYNLSTHLPWIGERTRGVDGPHVEFMRGIRNPVGVKLGPGATADDVRRLLDVLNPKSEAGKIVLIPRLGVGSVRRVLPGLLESVKRDGRPVLWVCDPMHGNGSVTRGGVKTRSFDDIMGELGAAWEVHTAAGVPLGGVHVELTSEDVTECLGGASGLTEEDLGRNYASPCDPRLNYEQAMELAFALAKRMQG